MASDPDHDAWPVPIEAELDLHTYRPQDVVDVVEAYVTAAHAEGLRDVRVVHGRGRGVQRARVQEALARHPLVESFRDDTAAHLGATLVRLAAAALAPGDGASR